MWIVTKYASGGDLERYAKNKNLRRIVSCLDMELLHSKEIIHRDLKPGNILIEKLQMDSKILKIGDFGISKIEKTPKNMKKKML